MKRPKIKVIVAEDNLVQRSYFMHLIAKLGYDPVPAEDGLQALMLVREIGAPILLCDFKMPNIDGLELTRRVRKLELGHYVHIIMITGNDEEKLREEALDAGADDFLTKRANLANLKARIRTAQRLIRHEAELAERTRILRESNERIQNDLKAAAAAQRNLLPEMKDEVLGFRVSSAFEPSSFVSGDMFGCFPIDEEILGFYAIDVAGHGVQASLLSVAIGHLITPEYFRTRVVKDDGSFDPAALVAELNDRFAATNGDEYFAMFCGAVNRRDGALAYCQAAYPSPYFVKPDGQVDEVGDGGFPVGMFETAEYENGAIDFTKGGTLVMCSDAATEAADQTNQQFGTKRLRHLVAQNVKVGVETLPDKIVRALSSWRCGMPLEDDLTVIALERTNS